MKNKIVNIQKFICKEFTGYTFYLFGRKYQVMIHNR